MSSETVFITCGNQQEQANLGLMIDSLRAFGGEMARAPFWIFSEKPGVGRVSDDGLTSTIELEVAQDVCAFPFGRTVAACAQAEAMLGSRTNSLVWMDPSCLVIQPPGWFHLGETYDAAFRPVHIRNIGSPACEALDSFWGGIYEALGVGDLPITITSFVDQQLLRPYFNSHAFSINPCLGIMRLWLEAFQQLIRDQSFQSSACRDDLHKIFLFQALLSTLVASRIEPRRLRILPANYNYPYNLHNQLPVERRARTLNELVCLTYEGRNLHPDRVKDIQVLEPLRTWLFEHL